MTLEALATPSRQSEPVLPSVHEAAIRILDAWSDTIETRGISEVIDSHDVLIVHVDQRGLLGGDRREANVLAGSFDGEQNRLVVHGLT